MDALVTRCCQANVLLVSEGSALSPVFTYSVVLPSTEYSVVEIKALSLQNLVQQIPIHVHVSEAYVCILKKKKRL